MSHDSSRKMQFTPVQLAALLATVAITAFMTGVFVANLSASPMKIGPSVKTVTSSNAAPAVPKILTTPAPFLPKVIGGTCLAQSLRDWTQLYSSPDRMAELHPSNLGKVFTTELYGLVLNSPSLSLQEGAYVGIYEIYRRAVYVEGQPVTWESVSMGSANKDEAWAYMAQVYLFYNKDGETFASGDLWVPLDDLKPAEGAHGCTNFYGTPV